MSKLFNRDTTRKAFEDYSSVLGGYLEGRMSFARAKQEAINHTARLISYRKADFHNKVGAIMSCSAMMVVTGKAVAIGAYKNALMNMSEKYNNPFMPGHHIHEHIANAMNRYHPLLVEAHNVVGNSISNMQIGGLAAITLVGAVMLLDRGGAPGKSSVRLAERAAQSHTTGSEDYEINPSA